MTDNKLIELYWNVVNIGAAAVLNGEFSEPYDRIRDELAEIIRGTGVPRTDDEPVNKRTTGFKAKPLLYNGLMYNSIGQLAKDLKYSTAYVSKSIKDGKIKVEFI